MIDQGSRFHFILSETYPGQAESILEKTRADPFLHLSGKKNDNNRLYKDYLKRRVNKNI